MPALCTIAEALSITQRTVTEAQLTQARYDIETVSGRLFVRLATGVLCDDDSDWLTRAIAHQAAFIAERPEKDIAVDAVPDGVTPDGLFVAAMARRALANVSWVGARSARITRSETVGAISLDSTRGDIPEAPWRSL